MSRQARYDKEQQTDVLLESYQNLNGFLCSFIDQSLVGHIYFIRNRYLLEKIFDHEFQLASRSMPLGPTENLLLIGKKNFFVSKSTESVLFFRQRTKFHQHFFLRERTFVVLVESFNVSLRRFFRHELRSQRGHNFHHESGKNFNAFFHEISTLIKNEEFRDFL